MRILFLSIAVAAVLAGYGGAARAQQVVPASVMEIEPWGMLAHGPDLPADGIYVEMMRQIAEGAGLTARLSVKPYPRTIVDMASGASVFTLMSNNPGIEQAAVRLAPVKALDVVVLGRDGARFAGLASLHGKRVATLLGTDHDAAFRDDALILKETVKTTEQQLMLLQLGRVDAIFGVKDAILYTNNKLRRTGKSVSLGEPLLVSKLYGYLYLSKKHDSARMRQALLDSLEKLKAGGQIDRISKKYLDQPIP